MVVVLVFLIVVGLPAALLGSIHAGAVVDVFVMSLRDLVVVGYLRRCTLDRVARPRHQAGTHDLPGARGARDLGGFKGEYRRQNDSQAQ